MRQINFKFFSILLLLALLAALAGCGGGGTASSNSDVVELKADKQQVVGYWTPQNPANDTYEFFFSPTEPPYSVTLNTGRILRNGIVANLFYWDLLLNGTITVRAVSPTCMQRPLNLCPVISAKTIVAKGSSVQDSSWTISSDDNTDGVTDNKVTDTYHRADIDLSGLSQGDFFLTHSNNKIFDTPIPGTAAGGAMSIRLDDFDLPVVISAASYNTKNKTLEFSSGESSAVMVDDEFYVTGSGYITFPVKAWYDHVSMSSSANGEYSLGYELHRKVQIPPQIDAGLVELGTYEVTQKKSMVTGILNKFVSGAQIHAPQKIYASIELDFDDANAGNDLLFTSATEGTISYSVSHHPETPREVHHFNWTQGADGSIVFNVADYGVVTMRFIQAIRGGYQVLYSTPDDDYGTVYKVRDFILDDVPAMTEQDIVGRYKFTSISPLPNGTHEYEVIFHLDGTVTGVVGGYWFKDVNGDIVSFECTNAFGKNMTAYADCAAAMDDTSTVTFAHIRRVRFMYKDGNSYQSKYTGTAYGGRFTDQNDPFTTFALTYRWVRVGDEPDDDDD